MTRIQTLWVAAEAEVDPRTVENHVRKGKRRGLMGERIDRAIVKLGYVDDKPPEPTVKQ